MIPDSFAPTLELLSSGDREQIRRGLRQATELGADIPGVVSALEQLFSVNTGDSHTLLDEMYDLFEFKDSEVEAGLEDEEDSGVVFEPAEARPVAFEKVLRVIPLLIQHLPWTPQMQSSFALFTWHSFHDYFTPESPVPPFYSNLTQHNGPIILEAITSPQAVFYDSTSSRVCLHDHVKGFESFVSRLEEVVDDGDSCSVESIFLDSSPDVYATEGISKIRELLPEFRCVLAFEGESFGVYTDDEGNYYLDEDGDAITEADHPEIYYWSILARV